MISTESSGAFQFTIKKNQFNFTWTHFFCFLLRKTDVQSGRKVNHQDNETPPPPSAPKFGRLRTKQQYLFCVTTNLNFDANYAI